MTLTSADQVMGHVRKQGVSDVREVEDLLLAHLGLVPTLGRPGRPMSVRLDSPGALPWDLDKRLCARLKIDLVELDGWLTAQHTRHVSAPPTPIDCMSDTS